jgi:branched-chain amino acid transport system ATP-binding protein
MGERIAQRAGNLSGGEQQMLTLARAIVNRPRLLLVDEPSLGLSPVMADEAFAVLREFQALGMTILIVEQNVRKTLRLVNRAYILRQGQVVASGSGAELLQDPAILSHYLGTG